MSDVTAGYTFSSGEKNITHTKLNAAAAGTVAATFHTAKPACDSNPAKAGHEIMVYDTVAGALKIGSLSKVIFDSTELLSGRTAKTAPTESDFAMLGDAAAANATKKVTLANLFGGSAALTGAGDIVGSEIVALVKAGALNTVTLLNLIEKAGAMAAVVGTEQLLVSNGTNVKRVSLANLVDLSTALAGDYPVAADTFLMRQATDGTLQKVSWTKLHDGMGVGTAVGADQAIPAARGLLTFEHSLGYIPRAYRLVMIRTAAGEDAGTHWLQNDEIDLRVVFNNGTTAPAFTVYTQTADATTKLYVLRSGDASVVRVFQKSGASAGSWAAVDAEANYKIRLYV